MNLPSETALLIKEQMKTSVGSVVFTFDSPDFTNKFVQGGIIFENVSGKHAFILERTDDLIFNYFYSSPGTGTSVASIDLKSLPKCKKVFICFTWSPKEISLSIGPKEIANAELISAYGKKSTKKIRIGDDGSIFLIGDENIDLKDVSIFTGGDEILSSTAFESWDNIKNGIEILGTSKSDMGYIHECVVTNLSLSVMVTGFESYLKKRFLELEEEGIKPKIEDLLDSILSSKEKEKNISKLLIEEAKEKNISTLKYIVMKRKINFQNFDDIKKAYGRAYNVTLVSANIDSRLIIPIKQFLKYRHKIIHVSPMLGVLNQEKLSNEEPVFPNVALKSDALKIFNEFIILFHESTLKLGQ